MEELEIDLVSKSFVKNLLKRKGIHPSKKFGQNFLISRSVLEKILKGACLKKTDIVLEVGPGIGTLTKEVAKKVKRVIAVEKDLKMIEILKQTLKDFKNVEIIAGDILKTDPKTYKLGTTNYRLISNLPYYITSPVLRKFLEAENPPQQMILMVQKEVAQRICAKPPKMSILAVSVQFYAKPEIISYVSKRCFWPQPKVDSAIIKIVPRRSAYGSTLFCERFFRIVRAGFAHPRKQLVNSLAFKLKLEKEKIKEWLLKNGVDPAQRAQTLTIRNWKDLAKTFKSIIIK